MNRTKVFTEEEINSCIEFRKSGLSLAKIARKMKTDDKKLRKILQERGFEIGGSFRRRTLLNVEYFKEIDTPEKAYWLGFIAADGCVHKEGWKMSLISKDADILLKFQKAIGSTSPVNYSEIFDKRTQKSYGRYMIQICSKQFAAYIREHGIDENKSRQFKFPVHLDKNLWVHFIRGMFDGDGGLMIRFDKNKNEYQSTNINIVSTFEGASFLKNFVENELALTVKKIRSVDEQGIHYFEMTKDSVLFLNWVYSCSEPQMRLDRKYDKFMLCQKLYEEKWPIHLIINHSTGERYETRDFPAFCRTHGLNLSSLKWSFREKTITTKGANAGWELKEIRGKPPRGKNHL